MKIIVSTPYFKPKTGGLENYAYAICRILVERGYDIHVITSNHIGHDSNIDLIDGIVVHRLPENIIISNTPFSPKWVFSIRNILKDIDPDCHISHIPVPGLPDVSQIIAKRLEIPTILTYHNDLVKSGKLNYLCRIYNNLVLSQTMNHTDHLVATSRRYLNQSPYISSEIPATIIPPGINSEQYSSISSQAVEARQSEFPQTDKIAFTIAQLDSSHRHKGIKEMIHAAKLAKEKGESIGMVIGGSGNYKSAYVNLCSRLGVQDRVQFTGYIPQKDLPSYYAAADVTALASTNESEGFGMILLESLAAGTPVIGTNVGGIPAVIEDGLNGLIIPPSDPEKIQLAVQKIGKGNYSPNRDEIHSTHSWEALASKTSDVIHELT